MAEFTTNTYLRLIAITAARCVAWRCDSVSIVLSPRNATRSRNGNKQLGLLLPTITVMLISKKGSALTVF